MLATAVTAIRFLNAFCVELVVNLKAIFALFDTFAKLADESELKTLVA